MVHFIAVSQPAKIVALWVVNGECKIVTRSGRVMSEVMTKFRIDYGIQDWYALFQMHLCLNTLDTVVLPNIDMSSL